MEGSEIEDSEDTQSEMEVLKTRALSYEKQYFTDEPTSSSPATTKMKNLPLRNIFITCREHSTVVKWSEINNKYTKCVKYDISETLKNGNLPRQKDVLALLLTLKHDNLGRSANCERECAIQVCLHWIYCNVYTISIFR